ncbi:MAG: EAL domain-containing protein [Candidatus Acidiferrales bacterium]
MSAITPHHKILIIHDNLVIAHATEAALAGSNTGSFDVEWVHTLSEGLERLNKKEIAAVILGLSLPDSSGIETFDKLFVAAPGIPILISGGDDDEILAKQAVERGAQDYLLPDHLNSYSLPRALKNAIERKRVEDALFLERERAIVTLNSIGDAVLCTGNSGTITYLNLVAEAMTGWGRDEATGKPLSEVFRIIDGTTRETVRDPLEMAVSQNKTVGITPNCILIRRDGFESPIEDSAAPIHDRAGSVIGAVIVFHDVSAARAMSLQMTHAAQHDVLTNLPNRILLNDRIAQSISLARRQRRPVAVLFMDLDKFKNINDSLGHAMGDRLLQSVSKRLINVLRRSDTVSRQGGDEFVMLLPDLTSEEDAPASAQKILLSLNAPHPLMGDGLYIGASIGISLYPKDGEDAETLIKNADAAMYHAKNAGRNCFQFFKTEMNREAVKRQSLEASLRHAVEREEFLLHYQPKVNLDTGEITGVEALVRWQHPDRGLVPPSEFVPVAVDCGLIIQIDRWVMGEACKQATAWHQQGLSPLPISVNVCDVDFRNPGFVAGVQSTLSKTGLEPRYLELELTERGLMENVKSAGSALHELKTMGLRLAVDGFGTGYSSLSYLQQFPLDVLKIDRTFIDRVSANLKDAAIVRAIIDMARSFNLRVIAEGIETQEQRTYLQTQHCAEGQGYLFSRPMLPREFAHLLKAGLTNAVVRGGNGLRARL